MLSPLVMTFKQSIMRRFFLLAFFSLLVLNNISAGKRITIKGVQYETASDNTATAALGVMAKGEVSILETVEIGKQRYLVVQVNEAFFKKNHRIKRVILPKSIKTIKAGAFRGCVNMDYIKFPSGGYVIEKGAFEGCKSLSLVDGNLLPFLADMEKNGENKFVGNFQKSVVPLFSAYADDKLKQRMTLWQAKKDYETIEQYKTRVTDENRRKRMDEYVDELKKEYMSLYAPVSISTGLGVYDSEYDVYTIQTVNYGMLYARVPKSDAANFRLNYDKVEVIPQFGVVADTLAITGCQFKLGDKIYTNAANYAGGAESKYNFELPPLDINIAIKENHSESAPVVNIDNTVDKDIPKTKQKNDKTFALIIGNEQYKRESKVPFANNDAKVFAEYCKKTLGLPANNVKLYLNAGLNDMRHAMATLVNTLKAYDGEAKAIVYYAGHGIPDEASRMPYLLPVDGFATDIKSGYSLSDMYDELASAPSQMTMVFLDACFSGAKREGGMLVETRGIALATRNAMPTGNLLVLSASQGDETAFSDKQHGHGLFTYYLLKHLQETEGETTISKMSDFIITNVKRSSVTENEGKIQTPTIIPSTALMSSWQNIRLR